MSLVRETRLIWNITFNVNQNQLDPAYLWPSEIGETEATLTGELSLGRSVLFKKCISKTFFFII